MKDVKDGGLGGVSTHERPGLLLVLIAIVLFLSGWIGGMLITYWILG